MSKEGIKIAAGMFAQMQNCRNRLLEMGMPKSSGSDGDKQDILLGQLFKVAKDAIKDDFCRITLMENTHAERS